MYNFRYHLITIVSIFVALALGLLLGAALASSELAQQTTDDMIDSVMSRYDTLTQTNTQLEQEAADNLALSTTLFDSWAKDRLEGRTIALLLGSSSESEELGVSLAQTIQNAGGSVVAITVEQPDFGLSNNEVRSTLQEIVPEEPGRDYQQTLAEHLLFEWTFLNTDALATEADLETAMHLYLEGNGEEAATQAAPAEAEELAATANGGQTAEAEGAQASASESALGGESGASGESAVSGSTEGETLESEPAYTYGELSAHTPLQQLFYDHYALTRTLLAAGVISISADYSLLLEHTSPSAPFEQQAALEVATAWQLPYGINGLVNGFAPQQGVELEHPQLGLYLALALEAAGQVKELPYPNWLRAGIPARASIGSAEQPSYVTLLIQPDHLSLTMEASAKEANLSCVTTPYGTIGRYCLVALLSGAQAGIYGTDQPPERRLAPQPEDNSGRAFFR